MKEQKEKLPSWNEVKSHTFSEVKEFYERISNFPQEILDHIIFYGGTILYIAAKSENVDRCFGDVDVLVPAEKLSIIRQYLENTEELTIQYDGKKIVETYKINSADGIQDFGFKGILYGIKLSVHPIEVTKEGNVITKWIKTKNEDIDLVANCIMLKNSNLKEILNEIKIQNKIIKIIKPEIIVGWKMRRMEGHDEEDIKFVLKNKKELEVEENTIKAFREKMLDYDVNEAYKIKDNKVEELGRGKYEDFY